MKTIMCGKIQMIKSKSPRKQRKARYKAPLHRKRKMVASHLSDEYLSQEKYYPRSIPVKKGDTVKIIRGDLRGHIGKVASVNTKKCKITIEGATYVKADGTQIAKPIDPSNVIITKLDLTDPRRKAKIESLGGGK